MFKKRIDELTELLNKYSAAYYNNDAPLVSDSEYDALYDELVALEKSSGYVNPASPSRRVGLTPISAFENHTHIARLYSLDKVQSLEALTAWVNKINERYPDSEYSLEYKFDGLTVNLTYDGGVLTQASTRGNGIIGEGILPQIMTIKTIPLTIPFKGKMEVQGEGYMRLSVLDEINKSGTEQLKNARNAAAGALRNLDPAVTAKRHLDCACYNIGYIEGKEFNNHHEMMEFLTENGLPVSPYLKYCKSASEITAEIEKINRNELDILIDGMVVKLSDFTHRNELGYTERFPKWAIAYKFPAEEVTTTVLSVSWEVGRTGKLTPLAQVEPVELCGATIRRATLNNYDDIRRKRINVGGRVFIRRSNDVIPEILGSVTDDETRIIPPTVCPSCGAHVEQRGAHLFCTNTLSCKPQIVSALVHFASRNAMDIETFSDKTAELFVDKLGINSIPQLYELTAEQLEELPLFGKKKATALINAIENSKHCSLARFIFAIGIPGIGQKTAKDLAKRFKSLENLSSATRDELLSVDEVGEVLSDSIIEFFADERISASIQRMRELGVEPVHDGVENENGVFAGMTIVVTGKLETMDRTQAESLIEQNGGKASSSVSKKTTMVLAGESAGSKLDKAQALGVRVISESEFLEMIGS